MPPGQKRKYIALGNLFHTLARLSIDSTLMEDVDAERASEEFKEELDGHVCEVAISMGHHLQSEDYNHGLPKARMD